MSNGMDFFSLDVALDEKWELIEAEFGITGFGVIVKLLQRIYGGQGYYVEWTNEVALLFARKIGVGGSVVSEIVSAAIKRGIFDKTLYGKYGVLTSAGIQKRYFKAVSRRKSVEVIDEYLLAEPTVFLENVSIFRKNVSASSENANISEQRKVKESKGKKRKEKESTVHVAKTPEEALTNVEEVQKIVDLFNSVCVSLSRVIRITPRRFSQIEELRKLHAFEDFKKCFENAESCAFLKGANKQGWKANFDWIIDEDHFVSLLEGSYNNTAPTSSFDTDDFFNAAIANSYKDLKGI